MLHSNLDVGIFNIFSFRFYSSKENCAIGIENKISISEFLDYKPIPPAYMIIAAPGDQLKADEAQLEITVEFEGVKELKDTLVITR